MSTPLRQEVLLLELALLIALAIRIVNSIEVVRVQSSWSNTPSRCFEGCDCQRIMHRTTRYFGGIDAA